MFPANHQAAPRRKREDDDDDDDDERCVNTLDGAAMTNQLPNGNREDKRPLVDANPTYDPDAMES